MIIGRLARDPELRYTPQGTAVCNFTLAVERPFTNRQGENEVDFIDCVAWRRQAENVAEYLSKGRPAAVEGRLQVESYQDREGVRRRSFEVVADRVQFLPGRQSGERGRGQQPERQAEDAAAGNSIPEVDVEIDEDDVPF